MPYYKFLTEDNRGEYSGFDFTPYLPDGDTPGEWLPEIEGKLEQCENGYHACEADDISFWLDAQLYEVEYREEPEHYGTKVNGRQIRFVSKVETWNARTARLFAVWCAREALSRIDNPDPRSVDACDVAERYANGNATDDELEAASAAAWYAARSVVEYAASYAATAAAWYASRAAARYAASSAAWYAARAVARSAQAKKLIEMLEEG